MVPDNMPVLIIGGIQVNITEGTILTFYPTALYEFDDLRLRGADVQFQMGGVIFQIKEYVMKHGGKLFPAEYTPFNKGQAPVVNKLEAMYEGVLLVLPLILEALCRKDDEKSPLLQPSVIVDLLSQEHVDLLRNICELGELQELTNELNRLRPRDPNEKGRLLASMQLIDSADREDQKEKFWDELESRIIDSDVDGFRNLLLSSQRNPLAIGNIPNFIEMRILGLICQIGPTKKHLDMLSVVFDPNEFGGRYFFDEKDGNYSVFTELILNFVPSVLKKVNEIREKVSMEDRLAELRMLTDHLVNKLCLPINIRNRKFHIRDNGDHTGHPLLTLTKKHQAWIAFLVFAPFFPESERTVNEAEVDAKLLEDEDFDFLWTQIGIRK